MLGLPCTKKASACARHAADPARQHSVPAGSVAASARARREITSSCMPRVTEHVDWTTATACTYSRVPHTPFFFSREPPRGLCAAGAKKVRPGSIAHGRSARAQPQISQRVISGSSAVGETLDGLHPDGGIGGGKSQVPTRSPTYLTEGRFPELDRDWFGTPRSSHASPSPQAACIRTNVDCVLHARDLASKWSTAASSWIPLVSSTMSGYVLRSWTEDVVRELRGEGLHRHTDIINQGQRKHKAGDTTDTTDTTDTWRSASC